MILNKKQQQLFNDIKSSMLNLISISDPNLNQIAWQLHCKGLLEQTRINLPFCGIVSYWSITPDGHKFK